MIELSLWGALALAWGCFAAGALTAGLCAAARDESARWHELESQIGEEEHGPHR